MLPDNTIIPFQRSRERVVLCVLEHGEKTGYDIVRAVSTQGDGAFQNEEGMVYAVLHLLEGRGDVVSVERRVQHAPSRRYYRLTKQGARKLQSNARRFAKNNAKVAGGGTCVRKK